MWCEWFVFCLCLFCFFYFCENGFHGCSSLVTNVTVFMSCLPPGWQVTCEVRRDRVYRTFARAVVESVPNVVVVGGDALDIMRRRVRPGTVDKCV